jgi:thioredoxin 1
MEQLASLYKGKAIIGKLNIDDNAETPSKYEIKTIPSILIFYEALQVERLVGNVPIDTIQLALNKYLFKEKF